MPRIYTVSFSNVTVSAAQDLVSLKGSTGKVCKVRRAWVQMTNTTLQTAQGLRLNCKFASATITLGSGGGAGTAVPYDPGDAAYSGTARINDTTPATTSGAFSFLVTYGGHNYAGMDYSWGDKGPMFGLNQGFVFELLSTVSGTCAFSGGVEFEESGL